jgi:hypothetical protein
MTPEYTRAPTKRFSFTNDSKISKVSVGTFHHSRDTGVLSPLQRFQANLSKHIAEVRFQPLNPVRGPEPDLAVVFILQPPAIPAQPGITRPPRRYCGRSQMPSNVGNPGRQRLRVATAGPESMNFVTFRKCMHNRCGVLAKAADSRPDTVNYRDITAAVHSL